MKTALDRILDSVSSGETVFRIQEVEIGESDAARCARFRTEPRRFVAKIFEGEWGDPVAHPKTGTIRLVAVVQDPSGTLRLIGRQGNDLYAFPA